MTSEANKQPILEHISELRRRLTWALAALVVGTAVSFIFAERLLAFLIAPYGARVQAISPTDTISTYFKVALVSGAILTMRSFCCRYGCSSVQGWNRGNGASFTSLCRLRLASS
jgi:Sec-independent protein secretion pathway component TatC